MLAWAGSVIGTCVTAAVNRDAPCAKRSSAGVSCRVEPYAPSRSARSVSIVTRTIGRPAGTPDGDGVAAGPDPQAASISAQAMQERRASGTKLVYPSVCQGDLNEA